ncbi:hypothetical protein K461DRAFT_275586 [Myriangium duriaei CBS 260.36]|uniref:Zn(2)-C6 fungal-type domain-containing protein n=1 Tax=Myriangium duriaei CBS 260.36 TaxID=1168546 RepID=A0A9P4J6X5_9PEZI|nr:hypothetical protein K461DRAFT_275586 [Myriangium duriaei CBS 260.36]
MEPNGHNAVLTEQRPRKRQRQMPEPAPTHDIPIHPELQNADIALQNAMQQQPLRQNLETDHADYPRRRAIIACEVCRGRKTRCDGGKPKCRLCTDLGAECIYREPGQKLDAGDKLILEQLHRIEGMLHSFGGSNHSMVIQDGSHGAQDLPLSRHSKPSGWTLFDETAHGAVASGLLPGPQPSSPYLQGELSRAELSLTSLPSLDPSVIASKVESYFQRTHEWHALVNPNTWQAVYATASLNSFERGIESCTVLLIAALGSCAVERHLLTEGQEVPGAALFAKAWSLLPEVMLSNSTSAIQCLVLGSHYLLEVYRPLDAWNSLSLAVSKLYFQLMLLDKQPAAEVEHLTRVYWNVRLIKWSISTSLYMPTPIETSQAPFSGLLRFGRELGMPSSYPPNVQSEPGTDDSSLLVAQIELSLLAERISKALPDTQRDTGAFESTNMIDVLLPVAANLEDQLNQWYDRLPDFLRFPHDGFPPGSSAQITLRHRFFASRADIFRPFVLALKFAENDMQPDPLVGAYCKKCLEASIRQIEYTSAQRAGQLGFKTANDIAAETLFIMGATRDPALSAMLPPPQDLKERLIDPVITELDKLGASISPTIAVKVAQLRRAEEKRLGL